MSDLPLAEREKMRKEKEDQERLRNEAELSKPEDLQFLYSSGIYDDHERVGKIISYLFKVEDRLNALEKGKV